MCALLPRLPEGVSVLPPGLDKSNCCVNFPSFVITAHRRHCHCVQVSSESLKSSLKALEVLLILAPVFHTIDRCTLCPKISQINKTNRQTNKNSAPLVLTRFLYYSHVGATGLRDRLFNSYLLKK